MKKHLVAVMVVAILTFSSAQALAETILISPPLSTAGSNGTVCTCVNMTKNPITISIVMQAYSGGTTCPSITLSPIGIPVRCSNSWDDAVLCKVIRDDGRSVSSKQVSCTFSAIDANGNPTVVVPVNKKFKQ